MARETSSRRREHGSRAGGGMHHRKEPAWQPREFEGRTALVTGGSRGIGRATCVRLAQEGARVAINYAGREDAAQETVGWWKRRGVGDDRPSRRVRPGAGCGHGAVG